MIRNKFLSLSFLLLAIATNYLTNCESEGFFTIIGGNLLKLHHSYQLSVTYQGYTEDKILQIGIRKNNENSTKFRIFKNVTLNGDGIKNIEFDTTNHPEGRYVLEVKSMTGESFNHTTALHMNTKKFSTFIQTDKSIYKPGDTVKFRILVLDADTKPFNFNDIEVFVTDGGRNRVKSFENPKEKFVKGVYRNELQLSDQPVMGRWKINVKVNNGTDTYKEFQVDEYVLPKFELTMDTEPANFKDGKIRATVKAKYTFGKFAKGTAEVTAKFRKGHYNREERKYIDESVVVAKHIDVDGKTIVEFDAENELKMNKSSWNSRVELVATFVEELTKKEVNVSKIVYVEKLPYNLELFGDDNYIKPGIPAKVTAKLTYYDKDMPITDPKNPVKFNIKYEYDIMRTCIRQEYPDWFDPYHRNRRKNQTEPQRNLTREDILHIEYECREIRSNDEDREVYPKNGLAEIFVELSGNISNIVVEASYLDVKAYQVRLRKSESENNRFLHAFTLGERTTSDNKIIINVKSNVEINQLYYKILSDSGLIDSKSVKFEFSKEHKLVIEPTTQMGSSIEIIIYYITEDGEIVSDKVNVNFDDNLPNYINLDLQNNQTKPSSNIAITVNTNKNSYVGLLGVDQSVLLLKSGNDLDAEAIKDEYSRYNYYDIYNYLRDQTYTRRYYANFGRSTIIITNSKEIPNQKYIPLYRNDTRDLPLDGYHWNSNKQYFLRGPGPVPVSAFYSGSNYAADRNAPALEIGISQSAGGSASGSSGGSSSKPIEIRKEFPETWLFEDFDTGKSNTYTLSKKVPDTITSWIITGFSLNPNLGLGLTKEPTKLNVFQPFFVSTNLPYSIKRGEVVSIPFAVFNYLGTDQQVSVKFFNSDREFEFVEVNEAENSVSRQKRALEKERTKEIFAKSNEGTSVSFMIRPLKVGSITIKVTAECSIAGDGVERQLKVEPEGVAQYFNEAVFVDLRNQKNFRKNIQITVPSDAVEDSTRIEASVIGDILGPTLENIENLIQLPYGCAEQNMLKFVPNILVLEYLTNLNKLNPETEAKLKKHLDVGYQKQLTYKNKGSGSYSGFGQDNEKGSTWLTAYVAKSFNQASKYINIDQEVITDALDFLVSVQTENGSFPEYGHVSYTPMQGGASKGIGLTAYTLITFLENKQHRDNDKYKNTIKKALDYVVKNVWELDNDIYALAIASYALQLAGHEKKDELLAKLNNKAEETEGMKYWKKESVVDKDNDRGWYYRRRSTVNVEMTSYAMLAFILADRDQQTTPIMKWLVSQRNYRGGFQSTQDTVVGLQALSQLASKIPFSNNQMTISVKPGSSSSKSFDLKPENSLILQKAELPSNSRTFEVTANGNGFAILQISYKYNLDNSGKHPRFILKPTIDSTSNKEFLNLKVCTSFVPDSHNDKSNMAIMEVILPSGFTFDNDQLPDLLATEKVKKVETKDGDTVIMVYFDDIGSSSICPSFHAYRTHAVANQKPAPIVVYDYYDNSRHARAFYNAPEISLCDICQGADDCKDHCEVPTIEIQ